MYRILVICLIVLLSLPGFQYVTGVFKIKPLNGVVSETEMVPFTFGSYLSFEYQTSVLKIIDRHFGFRPFFIRLYNQVDYSLFNIPHPNGVTIGKQGYLFEPWYIHDYLGDDFIGKLKIEKRVKHFSNIRNLLKQFNTELLVVLSPGKSWFYPEFIPNRFIRKQNPTNYQTYANALAKSDVPYMDVNAWFMQLKKNSEYPMYTKTGTHWSEYGAKLTADSLIKKCETVLGQKMNRIYLRDAEWSTKPRNTDNDLEKILNLCFPLSQDSIAYPVIEMENRYPIKEMPSVIVISDSFYWNMYDGTLNNSFRSNMYWYYYNSIFPQSGNPPKTVKDIDVFSKVTDADLVILMMSTAGLYKFGDGFVDDLLPYATKNANAIKQLLIGGMIKSIHNSENWMKVIKEKAQTRNIPIDSMVFLDANYLVEKKMRERKTVTNQ